MLPMFYLPGRDVVTGLIIVVGLGILAGSLPAIQAMRLRIAVALRRDG
jgi:putative ABC transport system permease protein